MVCPANGYFNDTQTMSSRQKQDFGIEAEALYALLLEENTRSLVAKGFKPALRVRKPNTRNTARHMIENDPGKFAKTGLMNFYQAAIDGSRANRAVIVSFPQSGH